MPKNSASGRSPLISSKPVTGPREKALKGFQITSCCRPHGTQVQPWLVCIGTATHTIERIPVWTSQASGFLHQRRSLSGRWRGIRRTLLTATLPSEPFSKATRPRLTPRLFGERQVKHRNAQGLGMASLPLVSIRCSQVLSRLPRVYMRMARMTSKVYERPTVDWKDRRLPPRLKPMPTIASNAQPATSRHAANSTTDGSATIGTPSPPVSFLRLVSIPCNMFYAASPYPADFKSAGSLANHISWQPGV
jgi:hypothetical protein